MRWPLLVVPVVLAPVLLAAPAGQAATVTAGQPILLRDHLAGFDALAKHVAPEQADTTIEPSIAVNPKNPLNAVLGFQVGRVDGGGDATNGYATTFDGGKTWKNGLIPGLTTGHGGTFDRASDAVVAFGDHNQVYFSSLIFNDTSGGGLQSAIVNNTSLDGGKTWGPVDIVQNDPGGGLNDKNWVVVDNGTEGGHHHGRVYVTWDRVAGVIVKYSDDQGKTWVPASPVYAPNGYAGQGISAYPVVKPNGDLFVAFMSQAAPPAITLGPGDELGEAVSGLSKVSSATFVGAGTIPTGVPLPQAVVASVRTYTGNSVRHQRAGSLLSADVDPVTGRIYVVWEDSYFRTDAANDAVLAWSDNGFQWSNPVRVSPGKTNDNLDHYNPSVAVHKDGTVDVIWRQRQESASNLVDSYSRDVNTYLARSNDHGLHFGTPLKVDLAPSDVRFGAFSRGGLFQGDYDQVATSGGLTYVVRCESYAPSSRAVAPDVPSATTLHHQTTWVAVVGTATSTAKVSTPTTTPVTAPVAAAPTVGGGLAATGGRAGLAGLGLLLLAAVAVRRRFGHSGSRTRIQTSL
jgi:hypothetical protein